MKKMLTKKTNLVLMAAIAVAIVVGVWLLVPGGAGTNGSFLSSGTADDYLAAQTATSGTSGSGSETGTQQTSPASDPYTNTYGQSSASASGSDSANNINGAGSANNTNGAAGATGGPGGYTSYTAGGADSSGSNDSGGGGQGLAAGGSEGSSGSQGGAGSQGGSSGGSGAPSSGSQGSASGSGAGSPPAAATPAVTLIVNADTASRGDIMSARKASFTEGETVFDVLYRECRANGIQMSSRITPLYNSAYVESIDNLYEFDNGPLSGWMYSVNGAYPSCGCSQYQLKAGDVVAWRYTCDLGRDIGGGNVTQG